MHSHDHGGSSAARADGGGSHRRRLAIACAITVGIVLAQATGAWLTGSLALLTDAVHSLTDSIGLVVALIAASLMFRAATAQRTWGFRRMEILAGLIQAALLLSIGIYAAVEGIARLSSPPTVMHQELLLFGAVGLLGNIVSLLVLSGGRSANLNMRAAFLEVAADALGSLGVMVAAVVVWTTGWQQADAVAALAIAALIVPRAALLLRESARVLLEFTPRGLDLEKVRAHMLAQEHVHEVHDLHASMVATGLPVISAHVVVDDECFQEGCAPETLSRLKSCVAEHFDLSVEHSTFQLETRGIAASETHTHA
ncbi:cation diffusion facilitator family transporter [Nesterenkonia halotolerans]|uniref:Cobalt-zinc-cadmium efflux system protein n=1 Tax=Nesterenkonia halotolerans TaxID=225325 RepID=A0ABR9J5S4_9MICC|nr:cation diffusion facilitator family transporter [Nesterenkonia halotolerans]MBE1514214.1 cobalt-zinc-cadmium efflux system protein [Nesterenkonia halotolerans]